MLEVPDDRDTLLERGVTALSDFAGRATLTDVEIEKERGVVLEDGVCDAARANDPAAADAGALPRLPLCDRTAHRLPEIIQHGSADRLRAYYRDWYTPDRMTVVASATSIPSG